MLEILKVSLKRLLPGTALSRFAGFMANCQHPYVSQWLIRYFLSRHDVNLSEAVNSDITSYISFNAFFTRALRAELRPVAQSVCICPADGAISELGEILHDQILQAKGHTYSIAALLGADAPATQRFYQGSFCTIYLSPKDYHRVHMPCAGKLVKMTYVPGRLLSVNPANARHVSGLFARNERVVCEFESDAGPFVMVLVGATIVGSIETVWHGVVNAAHQPHIQTWYYDGLALRAGEEMGRFMLGSTVIMLFSHQRVRFLQHLQAGQTVRLHEAMA